MTRVILAAALAAMALLHGGVVLAQTAPCNPETETCL